MTETYWLDDKPEIVISKIDAMDTQWRTFQGNPFYDMWFRNSYAYYSTVLDEDSVVSSLNFRGSKGELVEMKVPQARSLVRQMLTLITKQRLSFQAIAEIDQYNYIQNMRKTNALIQEELKDGGLDKKRSTVAEHALVLGTGFFACLQRFDRGAQTGMSPHGGKIFEGKTEIEAIHPIDMLYDFRISPFTDVNWVRITTKRNRFDLIAMYPELEQKILALPSCWERSAQQDQFFTADDRDMVFQYHLIHAKTPAMPKGRYLCYSDKDTAYYDDENIFGGIPVCPVIPEEVFTYSIGYPILASLLPSQEMYDHDYSAVATNHSALAIRNMAIARNSNVSIQSMPGGLNLISYTPQNVPGGGKPEVLDFNLPNNDVYNFQDKLLNNMQQMTNINSAIRGEVSSGASGVSIATLSANAIEFMSSYAMAVEIALENIVTWKIKILSNTVKSPRKLSIASSGGVAMSDSYTGDDLKGVVGIKLISTNPLLQTQSGREMVADKLLQSNPQLPMQEYIAVLDGAPPERMYGDALSVADYLLFEREQIMKGQQPTALATDNHAKHIQAHAAILNNPAARMNKKISDVCQAHILEHLRLSKQTDPELMAMADLGVMPQGGPPPPSQPAPGPSGIEPLGPQSAAPQDHPAGDLLGRGP